MEATAEIPTSDKIEQLEKMVTEQINRMFEEDSRHFNDGYIKQVAKEKAAT
jgi:hypothetical protein